MEDLYQVERVSSLEKIIEKAGVLIEALPYMKEFSDQVVVIKYGGNAMINQDIMSSVLEDIALLKQVGVKPVIVHGGGPIINNRLKRLNIESQFHNGLRITTEKIMEVVEEALIGHVNTNILSLANSMGSNAVGLSGKDNNLIMAQKYTVAEQDLGYVGEIEKINPDILENLLENDYLPVIAPVGTDEKGQSYNINADLAAGYIASALGAEKLILLTNVDGILTDPEDKDSVISQLTINDVEAMIEKEKIIGGMIPKVRSCIKALNKGVSKTHILDGRVSHALLLEIFTDQGIGTMIKNSV